MKTIEFEGKKYEVADWVNWVAMDDDFEIWCFKIKPEIDLYSNGWVVESCQRETCYYLDSVDYSKNWQDSLTKV